VRLDIGAFTKKNAEKILLLTPLVAFAVPLLCLYLLNPVDPYLQSLYSVNPVEQNHPIAPRLSFELMWKGRTFQLFFCWLIALELILGWEIMQGSKLRKLVSARSVLFAVSLMLPTLYVLIASYAGVNAFIVNVSKQSGAFWLRDIPIAVEYLVFAVLFSLMAFLSSGAKGLKSFSIPILFSVIVGAVFLIDSVYPNGQFTPFQFLVPATTMLAANTLNFMGYNTALDLSKGSLPQLTVTDPSNPLKTASFGIAWPCAGIESLLIFAVTIMLFLKRMPISWQAKLGYFAFGAGVTYFINILRIVSIFLFALGGGDVNVFHQTYGPLYPIAWIVSYPLIVLGSQSLWHRVTRRNKAAPAGSEESATSLEMRGLG